MPHPDPPRTASAPRVLALTVAVLALAGCSFSFSVGGVSASEIEDEIAATLEADPSTDPGTVDCDGGLAPTVGDTTECVITLGGVSADWIVEATAVDDDSVDFAWEIVEGSQTLAVDALVDLLGDGFAEQVGTALTSVTCATDELPGQPGHTATCEASAADGRTGGIEIRITAVSGMNIDFEWVLL